MKFDSSVDFNNSFNPSTVSTFTDNGLFIVALPCPNSTPLIWGNCIVPFPGSDGFSESEGISGSDGVSGSEGISGSDGVSVPSSGFCTSFSKTITFLSLVTIFPSASLTEYWTIFSPTVKVFKSVKQTKLLVISPSS